MRLSEKQIKGLSQNAILFKHMEKIGVITKLQALNYYGIMNTGARIGELRNLIAYNVHPHKSKTEIKTVMFQVSSGKRVAKYFISKY